MTGGCSEGLDVLRFFTVDLMLLPSGNPFKCLNAMKRFCICSH